MSNDPNQRWKITDTDVPIRDLAKWWLKMVVPGLIFVALAAVLNYFIAMSLVRRSIDPTLERAKKEMQRALQDIQKQ